MNFVYKSVGLIVKDGKLFSTLCSTLCSKLYTSSYDFDIGYITKPILAI